MPPKPRRVERHSASQNPEPIRLEVSNPEIRPENSHPQMPLSTIEGSPNPPEHSEDPSSYTKGKSRAETSQDEDADMADAEEDAETLRTLNAPDICLLPRQRSWTASASELSVSRLSSHISPR